MNTPSMWIERCFCLKNEARRIHRQSVGGCSLFEVPIVRAVLLCQLLYTTTTVGNIVNTHTCQRLSGTHSLERFEVLGGLCENGSV